MIYIYVKNKTPNSYRSVNFFKKQNIEYKIKNIESYPLTAKQLLRIVRFADDNFNTILNRNVKKDELLEMSTMDLAKFLVKNVNLLRYPIVVDYDRKLVECTIDHNILEEFL